jgi:hypothetical protein
VVKAKVVAVLEIKILDSRSQMIHSNSSHTEVVEEASLKVGGAKEDLAIRTDNSLDQILETVIIVANQAIGVATLALGSQPRQRGCKGAGQEEARESHHIFPRV